MVDYANQLQESKGYDRRRAIEAAAAIRLRPILMTTAAMVVGMLPLLIASGAGAASRYSIGLVIAAGMSVATLFTLFVTPAATPTSGATIGRRPACRSAAGEVRAFSR